MLFFGAIEVPTDYSIGILTLRVVPYKTYEEVEHAVQLIAEEVRRQLTSVS